MGVFEFTKNILGSAAAALMLAGAAQAATVTIDETIDAGGDFGATVSDVFVLSVGTTTVTGVSQGAADGDLLQFTVVEDALVTLSLDFITDDANLLLFTGAGTPLEGDDDDGPGLGSFIEIYLTAGVYLVGIGENNQAGFDADGNEIIDNDQGNCAETGNCSDPGGILAFVGAESQPGSTGPANNYILTIEGAGVPEVPLPAAMWVFLAGLAGICAARHKKAV